MKRVLFMSDLHCGHRAGLTPPEWQWSSGSADREKFGKIQRETWKWFTQEVDAYGPYDIVVVNGDAVDGKGPRSGGTELITTDMQEQCSMATQAIKYCMGDETDLIMLYGTAYHTGQEEDWEKSIALGLNGRIEDHAQLEIEGVKIDIRHWVGSSSTPYGRGSALSKEACWTCLKGAQLAEGDQTPDILIRSHVHYYTGTFDHTINPYVRFTLPALQASASKYGSRRCSGITDYGFVVMECTDGEYEYQHAIADLETDTIPIIKM